MSLSDATMPSTFGLIAAKKVEDMNRKILTEFKRKLSEPITLPENVLPIEYADELQELINEFVRRFGYEFCQEHDVSCNECFFALLPHNKEIAIEMFQYCEGCGLVARALATRSMWETLAMLYNREKMSSFMLENTIRLFRTEVSHETLEQLVVHFDKAILLMALPDLTENIESISNPLVKGINKISFS